MDALLWPVVIPLSAALLALLLPRRAEPLPLLLGALGTLGTLASGAALANARRAIQWPLVDVGGLNVDLALRVDGFSGWATAFVGLLGLLTVLYGAGWFRGRGGRARPVPRPGPPRRGRRAPSSSSPTTSSSSSWAGNWSPWPSSCWSSRAGGGRGGGGQGLRAPRAGRPRPAGGDRAGRAREPRPGADAPWSMATLQAHPIGSGGAGVAGLAPPLRRRGGEGRRDAAPHLDPLDVHRHERGR